MKDYNHIVKHYEACFDKYGDNAKGMDWPDEADNSKRFTVMLDIIRNKDGVVSMLDFGCGTAHLKEYINQKNISYIDYMGCDLSTKFIDYAKKKYPKTTFYNLDILKDNNKLPLFDYIICNGVFTEKQNYTFEKMWTYCKRMITVLYHKSRYGIAFNVMSKAVDWERDDLFHLPTDLLIDFMTKNLSRNFIIRNDYGLYEYTVYIYK